MQCLFNTRSPAFCCTSRHTLIHNLASEVYIKFRVKVVYLTQQLRLKAHHRQYVINSVMIASQSLKHRPISV